MGKTKGLQKLKCTRCDHKWWPRTPNLPSVCSSCNSPYWNKPRRKKKDPPEGVPRAPLSDNTEIKDKGLERPFKKPPADVTELYKGK
jgi:hypothetical protein